MEEKEEEEGEREGGDKLSTSFHCSWLPDCRYRRTSHLRPLVSSLPRHDELYLQIMSQNRSFLP